MELSGRTISGRYVILDLLGQGGMGQVYRARDTTLKRTVAIKVLWPHLAASERARTRFRREAQSAARLNHPSIVAVYDHGADQDLQYLVMEHLHGRTLAALLAEEGPLEPGDAVAVAAELGRALAAAHGAGIVHRDVKPGNVIVTSENGVKVLDFGIARAVTAETVTDTAAVMGTAAYLSPEQAAGGRADARSDIYALGVVLYEMLVGEPPFVGETPLAVAYKHLNDVPLPPSELRPGVPRGLDAVIARAMAKDPDQRYATAEAMVRDLDGVPEAEDTAPLRLAVTGPAPPERRTGRVPRLLRWALIALLLVGLAFAVPLLVGAGRSPSPAPIREERPIPTIPATSSPGEPAQTSEPSPESTPTEEAREDEGEPAEAATTAPPPSPLPSPSPSPSPTTSPVPSPSTSPLATPGS